MPGTQDLYQELIGKYRECSTLGSVIGLLQWDMQTMMPPKGAEARSEQIALQSGIMHQRLIDARVGELIEELLTRGEKLQEAEQSNVREIARDYRQAVKVPVKLVEELSRQQSIGHEVWVKARETADFSLFAPELSKLLDLSTQVAECLGYPETPYDALIDRFEPDATASMFTRLFDDFKTANKPLLEQVLNSPKLPDTAFLEIEYPTDRQKKFARHVMEKMGFDPDAGRLDTSVHPFCAGEGNDVRITARYNTEAPQQAIFGIIHETGHGLYEQGLPKETFGTPLSEPLSYGIHESQSRLWENIIGRSRAFWQYWFPELQKIFPEQLRNVSPDQFVLAVNKVQPDLVRTEADEMTYDLHIMLRFEIERDLFSGDLKVPELPEVWNDKMRKYLGLSPPDNGKLGVLQDVHWAQGSFGYFPSYSLGNLAAAQFWAAIKRDLPDSEQKISHGDFSEILHWLRRKVHCHGRRYKRNELMKLATGRSLGAEDYISYLKEKYTGLYGL